MRLKVKFHPTWWRQSLIQLLLGSSDLRVGKFELWRVAYSSGIEWRRGFKSCSWQAFILLNTQLTSAASIAQWSKESFFTADILSWYRRENVRMDGGLTAFNACLSLKTTIATRKLAEPHILAVRMAEWSKVKVNSSSLWDFFPLWKRGFKSHAW